MGKKVAGSGSWHIFTEPRADAICKALFLVAMKRIFLLSPAHAGGKRAQVVLNPQATFPIAQSLRSEAGATLADVFSFLSGLYFRGKTAYARAFGAAAYVITSNRGLLPLESRIGIDELRAFGTVAIDPADTRFASPLRRDAAALPGDVEIVLLGSVATAKYTGPLVEVFGERLRFPRQFIGRGDMSRGALMLQAAAQGIELDYLPVPGTCTRGRRAPRLTATG
jgi:hypothetical protein